ncbi:hypothetical protein [Filifactor alocis]|uniref:hypothetical protein n=1 Tax=Filifactor alocis TaxID=143361 RepID=UPI003FA08899
MKRNKILTVGLSCLLLITMFSGCSNKPKKNDSVVLPKVETTVATDSDKKDTNITNEDVTLTKKDELPDVVEEKDTTMGSAVGEERSEKLLALGVSDIPLKVIHRSFIDDLGVHNLEYTYTVAENADISKFVSPKIMVNGSYFVVDSIYKPQTTMVKTVTKEKVVTDKTQGLIWNDTLEYDGPDGVGTLNLDKSSVSVGVNSEKTNSHKVSATKSFKMNIKDEDAVPKAIKHKGNVLHLSNVSWSESGDGGQDDFGGEIGNTVTRTFTATAYYGGAYNTTSRDFKGTANYTGTILVKNAASYDYVVTYKPDYIYGIKNNEDSALFAMYGVRNSGMLYSLLILTFLMFVTLALLFIYLLVSRAKQTRKPVRTVYHTLSPTGYTMLDVEDDEDDDDDDSSRFSDIDDEYFRTSSAWYDENEI